MGLLNSIRDAGKLALALPVAAIAVVVFSPIMLKAALRQREVTASDVREVLRLCIEGADHAEDEYDTLSSRDFSDPRLQEVHADFLALADIDWQAPQARASFERLLTKVKRLDERG